jgi:RNA ligase (TIGR02306 family)
MAERRLATVRKINAIRDVENSDNLVVLTIDGWEVVATKSDNHKVGNLVVYCEIDSFLPRWEEFQFLAKNSYRKMGDLEGYRLRTIKLRGQLSEGLIIPLTRKLGAWVLEVPSQNISRVVTLDEEVSELLNIIKWDPPVPAQLGGVARGNFPSFIPKTDQERIENFFKDFERHYSDHIWEVSMKLDGSSFTSYFKSDEDEGGRFGVCSRNLDLVESEENAFWLAARKNDLENKLRALGRNIAIQAELMGPGIQGNREKFSETDIYVFDIFDIDTQTKITGPDREKIVSQLGLKHVPIIEIRKFHEFGSAKAFLEYAEGPSINHKIREGLVFKSINDPNVSFKAISKDFLLKQKD